MCSMHAFFHRTVFNCSPLSPHLFSQSGQYGDCYFERWDGVLNCSMARLMKILLVDVHPTYVVQLILIRSGKIMSGIILMACHMYCTFHFGIVFLLTLKKVGNVFLETLCIDCENKWMSVLCRAVARINFHESRLEISLSTWWRSPLFLGMPYLHWTWVPKTDHWSCLVH